MHSNFFIEKIDKIIQTIEATPVDQAALNLPQTANSTGLLFEFDPISDDELNKVVCASPSKSCLLDTLPTWLLKKSLPIHRPLITQIVNSRFHAEPCFCPRKSQWLNPY